MNYNMQKTSEIVEDTACQAQLYWLSNPMIPITMIVKGKLNTNIIKANELVRLNKSQLIKYTPQYSLRVLVPVKAKYFLYCSNLFITLTSLLIQHYQLLQVASS